jgi:hypothetical protein
MTGVTNKARLSQQTAQTSSFALNHGQKWQEWMNFWYSFRYCALASSFGGPVSFNRAKKTWQRQPTSKTSIPTTATMG